MLTKTPKNGWSLATGHKIDVPTRSFAADAKRAPAAPFCFAQDNNISQVLENIKIFNLKKIKYLWPVSCVQWPVFSVLCPVSCVLCEVSCVLCPVTNLLPIFYPSFTHLLLIFYPLFTHLLPILYPFLTHLLPVLYPSFTQNNCGQSTTDWSLATYILCPVTSHL